MVAIDTLLSIQFCIKRFGADYKEKHAVRNMRVFRLKI